MLRNKLLLSATMSILLLAGAVACGGSSTPTVSISSPTDGSSQSEKSVTFRVSGDTDDSTYVWDFGDGTTGENQDSQIEHTYSNNGNYEVTVKAQTADGQESESASISITIENSSPTALATAVPMTGSPPLTVQFNASGSTDSDGQVTIMEWDLGDGVTAFGPSIIHEYIEQGTYDVTLKVTDNDGASSIFSLTVAVEEPVLQGNLWEVRMVSTDDGQFLFEPSVLKIEPGDTIRWVNVNQAHSSTSYSSANGKPEGIPVGGPSWNSNIKVAEGSTFEYTFPSDTAVGSYPYFCIPHEAVGQVGIIIVGEFSELSEDFIESLPALAAQNMAAYALEAAEL